MNKKSLRDLCLLVVICLVAALALAITNQLTEGPIQQNIILAAEQTRTQMLSTATTFTEVELGEESDMDSCFEGYDADHNLVGYVIQTTVNGYAGEVEVTMGLDAESKITGVSVGGANFSETAGLGALAKEPAFTDQYIGKSAPITLVKASDPKGDNTVDAISGATRTSAAVNGGINLAGKYIADLAGGGSLNTASANGFGGPVAVTIELDDAYAISDITIGDDYFNETEGYGKAALDESFYEQFIGMTPPLALSDIDAIAGATVTSTAVVNAINLAYGQLTGAEAPATEIVEEVPAAEETPAQDIAAVLYDDGWRATAKGYAGPVTVMLAIDKDLMIEVMQVGSEDFAETPGFGAKAQDHEFVAQFLAKTLPITIDDIDAIAGATVTTNAVLGAIDAIYTAVTDDIPDEPQPYSTAAFNEMEEPATIENPAGEPVAVGTAVLAEDGAWSAAAQGFAGPVAVTLTVDETNVITSFDIGDNRFVETDNLGTKALEDEFKNQFVGKTLPIALSDIDGITGATVTSTAVISAIDTICVAANIQQVEAATDEPVAVTNEPVVVTDEPVIATEEPVTSEWSATGEGFVGPVAVKLTLDEATTITAIEIGDEQFVETADFGAKAIEDEFKNQFIGKTLPLADDDIDAITGATITTIAVLEAIDEIYENIEQANGSVVATDEPTTATDEPVVATDEPAVVTDVPVVTADEPVTATDEPAIATDVAPVTTDESVVATDVPETSEWSASAEGFAGPVAVKLTVDATNNITTIEIGDEQFAETAGLGTKALEDEFKNQFIGKTLPLADDDIDAIAGATITTIAVLEAIDEICETIITSQAASLSATVQGFAGSVTVTLTLDETNTVIAIEIGDEQFAETAGLGAKALEDEFKNQFIGKTLPLADDDIDAITNATVTTDAVLEAIDLIYDLVK